MGEKNAKDPQKRSFFEALIKGTSGFFQELIRELHAPSKRKQTPEPVQKPTSTPATSLEPELILIPAGEFLMGSDPDVDKNAEENEQPQHRLYLPDYYITKTLVTNAQYAAFVQATNHREPYYWENGKIPKGRADHPVVHVSWDDAMAFCDWLAKTTGQNCRLPTEAEWEKAARGTDGHIYPWGNKFDPQKVNTVESLLFHTTRVGQYSPDGDSLYGVADMAGNVWEWTLSLWGEGWEEPDFKYPYDPKDGRESKQAGDSVRRVFRGGSFLLDRNHARCAERYRVRPDNRGDDRGFRFVVSPISPPSVF